jgi:hypothetical protein
MAEVAPWKLDLLEGIDAWVQVGGWSMPLPALPLDNSPALYVVWFYASGLHPPPGSSAPPPRVVHASVLPAAPPQPLLSPLQRG